MILASDTRLLNSVVRPEAGGEQELEEARRELNALGTLLTGPLDAARIVWIQAQVDRRLGEKEKARQGLEDVFHRFLGAGFGIEAASVALELTHHEMEKLEGPDAALIESLARDLAAGGGLPSHLAAVMDFALLFPLRTKKGYFLDVLRQASDYLPKARINPALPFHPLPEPHLVFLWSQLSRAQRHQAAEAAGVQLGPTREPRTARDRWRIAWNHEATTGVRIEFPRWDEGEGKEAREG